MDLWNDNKHNISQQKISRRDIIRIGLITAAASIIPYEGMAAVRDFLSADKRTLCLYNLHSKESLKAVYWKDGKYIPDALADINYMLRDHYNGAVRPIDKRLINLLFAIQQKLDSSEPFHIISGYRTPKTNARLNKKGAVKKSLHIYGKAVDLRLPGHRLKQLRRAAYKMRAGGVGYYRRSNFVHLDVGRVRYW
jgi:uncharacterized protein YcbK (DUF882 family)